MQLIRHLPNFLTTLRLAAAPATAVLLVAGYFGAAFGIFAFAGLSDAADGFLAKRFNLTTRLGRLLDPVADKALMLALFVTLAVLDEVPMWLAVTVIARDVVIVLGLAIASAVQAPIGVQPLMIGKLCSAVQVIYIGLHLAALAFEFRLDPVIPADAILVAAFALVSLAAYVDLWLKGMRAARVVDGRQA